MQWVNETEGYPEVTVGELSQRGKYCLDAKKYTWSKKLYNESKCRAVFEWAKSYHKTM